MRSSFRLRKFYIERMLEVHWKAYGLIGKAYLDLGALIDETGPNAGVLRAQRDVLLNDVVRRMKVLDARLKRVRAMEPPP